MAEIVARRGTCGGNMKLRIGARRGFGLASGVVVLGYVLAACAPRVEGPAPVISAGAPAERGSATITIQRGQTLSEIARSYHVPMRVIAEANGLPPPYRIQVGRPLIVPGAGPLRAPAAPASVAALPPTGPPNVPPPVPGSDLRSEERRVGKGWRCGWETEPL